MDDHIKHMLDQIASSSVAKVTPPITVISAQAAGVTVSDVALWLTIVYTSIMIVVTIRDKFLKKEPLSGEDISEVPTVEKKTTASS